MSDRKAYWQSDSSRVSLDVLLALERELKKHIRVFTREGVYTGESGYLERYERVRHDIISFRNGEE